MFENELRVPLMRRTRPYICIVLSGKRHPTADVDSFVAKAMRATDCITLATSFRSRFILFSHSTISQFTFSSLRCAAMRLNHAHLP